MIPAVAGRLRIAHLLTLAAAALAVLLRVHLAGTEAYVHDEINSAIPLSRTISLVPGHVNLPLRGQNHGALPAYVISASSAAFGTTPLAYRALHVVLGLCTVVLVYLLVRSWQGETAARWAAALLAFNEYFLAVSARATAHVPHLFFVTAAVFAFVRFLRDEHPRYLYAAGAALGLAFYCKEHSALLVPVFLACLLQPRYRRWWRGPHLYAAPAVFALMLAPDLAWNLATDPETARLDTGNGEVEATTYSQHLRRIGGLGVSAYPAMFYGRSAVQQLHTAMTGSALPDQTPEYPSMNPALGLLLVAAVAVTTWRRPAGDRIEGFLLVLFWGMFGFFTFIAKGNPPGRLDPVSWIWVEATIVPAVILTGARLARAVGPARWVAWAVAACLLAYASAPPAMAMAARGRSAVSDAGDAVNHAAQEVAIDTVERVRSRPLRAVALAAGAGAAAGLVLGFCAGWVLRSRSPRRSAPDRRPASRA